MKVHVKNRDGVVVMKPTGRIIGPASDALRHAIIDEIKGSVESPNFVFDFGDVPRIDSVGIGVLSGLHVLIAERGAGRYNQHQRPYQKHVCDGETDYDVQTFQQ